MGSASLSTTAMRGEASVFLLILVFFLFGRAQEIEEPIDNGEAVDESLKGLLVNNSLAEENSYRCGVFYAGDEPGDVPRFTVFVLPKRFEMDCAKDPEEQKAEAKKECTELFRVILTKVQMESGSRKRPGKRIGDDLCSILKDKAKMKRLPGPGHPRFPDGLEIGFYYNVCTDKSWYDTELRAPVRVCCKRPKLYEACP